MAFALHARVLTCTPVDVAKNCASWQLNDVPPEGHRCSVLRVLAAYMQRFLQILWIFWCVEKIVQILLSSLLWWCIHLKNTGNLGNRQAQNRSELVSGPRARPHVRKGSFFPPSSSASFQEYLCPYWSTKKTTKNAVVLFWAYRWHLEFTKNGRRRDRACT